MPVSFPAQRLRAAGRFQDSANRPAEFLRGAREEITPECRPGRRAPLESASGPRPSISFMFSAHGRLASNMTMSARGTMVNRSGGRPAGTHCAPWCVTWCSITPASDPSVSNAWISSCVTLGPLFWFTPSTLERQVGRAAQQFHERLGAASQRIGRDTSRAIDSGLQLPQAFGHQFTSTMEK